MNSTSPFGQVLAELLIKTGYVRPNYSPDWMKFVTELEDVSYETLRKAVTAERGVSEKLMRRVADVLRVEPTVFVEYRLIQARRELDPAEVGWARAVEALVAWETGAGSVGPANGARAETGLDEAIASGQS